MLHAKVERYLRGGVRADGSSNNGSGGVGGSRDVLADAQHLPKRASVNTSTRVVARVHAAARTPRQEQMH